MRKSFTLIAVIVLAMTAFYPPAQAQEVSFNNAHLQILFSADTLEPAGTYVSDAINVNFKTRNPVTSRNFLHSARALITAADSVYAAVFIRFGSRAGSGVAGKDYTEVFVDSIATAANADTTAKPAFINLDLASYMLYPSLQFVVKTPTAGTGPDSLRNTSGSLKILFSGQGLPFKNDTQ